MNNKPKINIGLMGTLLSGAGKTTLGAALTKNNSFAIKRDPFANDIPVLSDCGSWGLGIGNLSDNFRWGRARREFTNKPKTTKASKEQKRQKKARKIQRKARKKK
jgi:hypothetical protein